MRKEEWIVALAIVALGFLLRAFIHMNSDDHFSLFLLIGFMLRPVIHNFRVSRQSFKTLAIGAAIAACVTLFPCFTWAGKNSDTFVSIAIGLPFSLVLDFDLKSSAEKTDRPTKSSMMRFVGATETAAAWTACMGMIHRIATSRYDEQLTITSITLFFIARGVAINSVIRNRSAEGMFIGIPASIIFSGLFFAGVISMPIDCWINGSIIMVLLVATLVLRTKQNGN